MPDPFSELPDLHPPESREFGDPTTTRKAIYDRALQAARQVKPVSNSRYSLELKDVDYEDPEHFSIAAQKKAILQGSSLMRRLRGTWQLKDASGRTLEEKRVTIAQIPYLTHRSTFILNGTEYTLAHQMRLRPGVFIRRRENGEVEGHINIMPGKGLSHRYFLEPDTGLFKMNVSQASLPLYPILRAMGVSDRELAQAWGNEILRANQAKDAPRTIDKLYARLVRKADPKASFETKRQAVVNALTSMELDPEVTRRTLGQPFNRLSREAALETTKKILAVNQERADPDDRDHLAFQIFLGPEDLIAERFHRDRSLLNQLLWKVSHKGSLERLPSNVFTKHVHGAILDSGLGQPLEEINPGDVFDQQCRVSRLGYGGIPSLDAVPDEARNVQPSHLGYIDLLRTPESFKVGIDSRLGYMARKGADGKIYTPFIDARTGQRVWKSPQEIADLTVAFPGEMYQGKQFVVAVVRGKTRFVRPDQVDLVMPHFEYAFSPMTNLVPLKSATKGQRVAMGSRFITQALPVHEPEAPLVRNAVPGRPNYSFEEYYGKYMGAVFARDQPGRVVAVNEDGITVRYVDGTEETHEIYTNFPYNRKTYLHSTPVVQPGDPVQPGQLLARSNYTDAKGAFAVGKNLRVAFIPFRGTNYEDAYVISESAARKLSSEHMYQYSFEWDDNLRKGKKNFVSIFPAVYDRKTLERMDDDGVIKPGTTVQSGDPLVLAAVRRELSHKQVHSAHKGTFANRSITWDHHAEGVVTDVVKTDRGVTVAVKALSPSQVGDKIANRYGSKGVIGSIVPDDQMPRGEDGKPYDLLANPLGVISRTNPSQVIETVLAKVARKIGKPINVPDFGEIPDMVEWTRKLADEHGISDTEVVTDPVTGRKIPGVLTGEQFIMKLHHTSESKDQGRGLGAYTAEEMPAKGGAEGSKRLALMDVNALLSHGATEVLRDAKLIRGQKNQEYFSALMSGYRPPTPPAPYVYRKFIDQLRAAGINVERKGSQLHIMALTDKDVDYLAGDREIQNGETVDWKSGMKPVAGGLFDVGLTGGHGGNRWSFIRLHEPMPNPVMEEPIRCVLGLPEKEFLAVLSGRKELHGQTGPAAIHRALKNINLDQALAQAREDIRSGRRTQRDLAIRRLKYLKGAKEHGIHPSEWMLNKVPVLPPAFRPVSVMQGSGGQLISDANYLYKEVIDANSALRDLSSRVDDVSDERLTLYQALKGVTGLGDPVQPRNRERRVQGMLAQIFGDSPKFGTVQQKLLGTTVDLVGRAVVVPNPDMSMDEVGLPENRAWEVYSPFLVRRLVRKGVPRLQALEYVKNRHELARKALLDEMAERPVLVNRAPVLHRYGLMAFWPKLVKGDTLHVSPIVVGGFGMDFDGDTSNYHVPASDEARDEAIAKMLPSRNLFSVSNFKVHYLPRQEYVAGLYAATSSVNLKKRPRVFATQRDALAAYYAGELDPDQKVEIINAN